tara:strand:- start:1574 stop:2152 length:579 start_codon:yes stop_codon:yes gene_type:complete
MSKQPFAEFLKAHHQATPESLRQEFGERAFLLVREPGAPPQIVTIERAGGAIGSDPEAVYVAKGLAATHCKVHYHPGFTSWVLVALEQTGVNGALAPVDRPLVLSSRDELRFPTARVRLQFYSAETLIERLRTAGATRRMVRPALEAATTTEPAPVATAEPPQRPKAESSPQDRPSRRMTRAASNKGVSWGD